ncbi:leucine-rich repeat-containing protein 75B [Crotalus adamanteus]|uniref:Leucine-rich repeat-containing protein 75B n=1 Tax=Crotalus adamanteus TaxID=8729 RepID=A0AAW1APW1_CROAD
MKPLHSNLGVIGRCLQQFWGRVHLGLPEEDSEVLISCSQLLLLLLLLFKGGLLLLLAGLAEDEWLTEWPDQAAASASCLSPEWTGKRAALAFLQGRPQGAKVEACREIDLGALGSKCQDAPLQLPLLVAFGLLGKSRVATPVSAAAASTGEPYEGEGQGGREPMAWAGDQLKDLGLHALLLGLRLTGKGRRAAPRVSHPMKGDPKPCAAGGREAGEAAEPKRGSILPLTRLGSERDSLQFSQGCFPCPGPLEIHYGYVRGRLRSSAAAAPALATPSQPPGAVCQGLREKPPLAFCLCPTAKPGACSGTRAQNRGSIFIPAAPTRGSKTPSAVLKKSRKGRQNPKGLGRSAGTGYDSSVAPLKRKGRRAWEALLLRSSLARRPQPQRPRLSSGWLKPRRVPDRAPRLRPALLASEGPKGRSTPPPGGFGEAGQPTRSFLAQRSGPRPPGPETRPRIGSSPAARRAHLPGKTEPPPASRRRTAGRSRRGRAGSASRAGGRRPLHAPPDPPGLPAPRSGGRRVWGGRRAAMGSRLSRHSGAEATAVPARSQRSLRGRSRPEERPRRPGPDCRLLLDAEKLPAGPRKSRPAAPYVRRVGWLREMQATLRERRHERAGQLLRLLRKVGEAGGGSGGGAAAAPALGMRAAPFLPSGGRGGRAEPSWAERAGRARLRRKWAPRRSAGSGQKLRSERGCRAGRRGAKGATAGVGMGRKRGGWGGALPKGTAGAPPARWVQAAPKAGQRLESVVLIQRDAAPGTRAGGVGSGAGQVQTSAHSHARVGRDAGGSSFAKQALMGDLGLEGTFLNDVLYKKAIFLNLVDPISHDLLMTLARDLECPKKEYDPWKSSDRICRQLIYHLTPHSKWHRSGLPHRNSHSSLKWSLYKKPSQDAVDLSGVPLSTRDIQHLASYLQNSGDHLFTIDLSFTDLKDEEMCFLMPFLWSLPSLTHLSLNGNHLTQATVKDLTDAMKDMAKFPSLAWIDLGNNVDVSSMPQPLLVGLRKRLSQQTTLPTIYESLDCASEASSGPETSLLEEEEEELLLQGEENIPPVAKRHFRQQLCER